MDPWANLLLLSYSKGFSARPLSSLALCRGAGVALIGGVAELVSTAIASKENLMNCPVYPADQKTDQSTPAKRLCA
eukprot:50195-Pelagomonas_calceolata.AAC.3